MRVAMSPSEVEDDSPLELARVQPLEDVVEVLGVPIATGKLAVRATVHAVSWKHSDRIDADSSGGDTLRIVDYKSGKAARHKDLGGKIDRGIRLQLALYAMAVASFFERESCGQCPPCR